MPFQRWNTFIEKKFDGAQKVTDESLRIYRKWFLEYMMLEPWGSEKICQEPITTKQITKR